MDPDQILSVGYLLADTGQLEYSIDVLLEIRQLLDQLITHIDNQPFVDCILVWKKLLNYFIVGYHEVRNNTNGPITDNSSIVALIVLL